MSAEHTSFPKGRIRFPGLTPRVGEINRLTELLPKEFEVFSYKRALSVLWVLFMGGTGTGKSTLFNALCGRPLSGTGVERPTTSGPILFAHADSPIKDGFPFPDFQIVPRPVSEVEHRPTTGSSGQLVIIEHNEEKWYHLILGDTPDLDSVEKEHRQITEDLYLLADAVVFVASEEKYADEVPYQFLQKVIQEKKPCFFLLNKVQEHQLVPEDIMVSFRGNALDHIRERVWTIPYAPSQPSRWIPEQKVFQGFAHRFSMDLSKEKMAKLRTERNYERTKELRTRTDFLLRLLAEEQRAGEKWLTRLRELYEGSEKELVEAERERFATRGRELVSKEIRRLFSRYDVLARPRRYIKGILLSPLRMLGFRNKSDKETRRKALAKARQKLDLGPVQIAVQRSNRLVLERLSPPDETSLLLRGLQSSEVTLKEEEISAILLTEQDRLALWLEEMFQKLSKGIPKGKQLGIYSASVLWGVLILSLEVALGGGFTVLDAVLGTALAPFVTKGTVELFAYHEIQKLARELAKRYQEVLLSPLRQQRKRYEKVLDTVMTPPDTLESLQRIHSLLRNWEKTGGV